MIQTSSDKRPSTLSFAEFHRKMERLFLDHQLALFDVDLTGALELIRQFETEIEERFRLEEKFLFPVYGGSDFPQGGAPEIFLGEHKKTLRLLKELCEFTNELVSQAPVNKEKILSLLDTETMFKKVLSHHFKREEALLFPTLDSIMSNGEKRKLLDMFLN